MQSIVSVESISFPNCPLRVAVDAELRIPLPSRSGHPGFPARVSEAGIKNYGDAISGPVDADPQLAPGVDR